MSKRDLPREVNSRSLSPEELVTILETVAGERCALTLTPPWFKGPEQVDPATGKLIIPIGPPPLIELRGWLHVEQSSELLIMVGPPELTRPWPSDAVIGLFALANQDVREASFWTVDGNDHFGIHIRTNNVIVHIGDQGSS